MTTRLDRLVLLLDTGSTASVRKAAAEQIGIVQKQHPEDLYPLLDRVLPHLSSQSWETRIAAGLAIKAICDNVPQWNPPSSNGVDKQLRFVVFIRGLLTFKAINIEMVLGNGKPLLSSQGKEFDAVDLIQMDQKQRMDIQKKMLREKLGLVDFFDEDDVVTGNTEVEEKKVDIVDVIQPKEVEIEEKDHFAGLSARERNQLKRKMRNASKGAPSKKVKEDFTVVSYKPKPLPVVLTGYFKLKRGEEWPFEALCEQLSFDLFSSRWETRHGAAVGIRQLINSHGSGIGKIVGINSKLNLLRNQGCLEDLCVRLLCVLALDRFADFVGDQAVVPVRETCAQALGVVLQFCEIELCLAVVDSLKLLIAHTAEGWAARLSGLIGLKYFMAVRKDLLPTVLLKDRKETAIFNALVEGLKDHSDDVRAVASSAMIPVTDILVTLFGPKKIFSSIVICLWDSLQELDDLTAATAFVMDLLSDFIKKPSISALLKLEAAEFFEKLVSQLFPFFRHALTSVRLSVLNTLITISEVSLESNGNTSWISVDLMRLLFQNFVLEERKEVLDKSLTLWLKVCVLISMDAGHSGIISELSESSLSVLLALVMSRIGKEFDERLFISYVSKNSRQVSRKELKGLNIPPQDRSMMKQDMTVISFEKIMDGRLVGARAIGKLYHVLLSREGGNSRNCMELLKAYLNSGLGIHRIIGAIIFINWCSFGEDTRSLLSTHPSIQELYSSILATLNAANEGNSLLFVELQDHLQPLYQDCQRIRTVLAGIGHQVPDVPSLASTGSNSTAFTAETAENFLESVCAPYADAMSDSLTDLYRHTINLKSLAKSTGESLSNRVYASLAAALVATKQLPSKLNPIIRNLMKSVQTESYDQLQQISSEAVAKMLNYNIASGLKTGTNEKIIRNACVYLCSNPELVPSALEAGAGILTIAKLKALKVPSKKKKKKLDIDEAAAEMVSEAEKTQENEQDLEMKRVLHRGAEFILQNLCNLFEADLFSKLPSLHTIIYSPLDTAYSTMVNNQVVLAADEPITQQLADSLHVIEVICKYAGNKVQSEFLRFFPYIVSCLTCSLDLIRHMASRSLAALASEIGAPIMIQVIHRILPLCSHFLLDSNRMGVVEALYHIVETMEVGILPYLIFLMAPLLGRMSDPDEDIRFIATNAFAQLVKLAPLEIGVGNPSEFTNDLIEKKVTERKFIGQLIGTEKVQEYEIPVSIAAELRPYQKEGVSWLAFLNRYGLHGVLCDDMGLGKTLQSICIITSDHYHRSVKFNETKSPDFAHCPSLIVCPSPLTGHWYFEIKKYAPFINSAIYIGDKSARQSFIMLTRLRLNLNSYDIVIVSYEVLRNDIDYFSKLNFNYCCLDEGHVIKNPNTKLTTAVKSVKSFHRLILSGTPVQNNVLDLWSLFDFLMPGFLGTAAQFNEKYGKPIHDSRDAKASSKEQEKGALALDALHKQVLPFVMRRMKEDVLEDLPPKIIQDYYCDLSDIQKMLYQEFSSMEQKNPDESGKEKGQHVFQALQYLRKLCNHPSFVLTKNHPMYEKVMIKLQQEKRTINDIKNAPKLLALQQLLLDCGIGAERNGVEEATAPHRVLIFAQTKSYLDYIQNDLFKKHMPTVTYMRLDGQITDPIKRHELIETFNQDPSIDVLLLTTHVGGLGLNLTGADTVIFMEHDWNPSKDLQAMDRAHRIGQKRVVNVYRLITRGTLEEKIMGLQKFKLNLSSSIINSDNSGIQSMDTNQILDLFSLEGEAQDEKNDDLSHQMTSKEAVESLGKLWDENEYDDLAVDDFLSNLKMKK